MDNDELKITNVCYRLEEMLELIYSARHNLINALNDILTDDEKKFIDDEASFLIYPLRLVEKCFMDKYIEKIDEKVVHLYTDKGKEEMQIRLAFFDYINHIKYLIDYYVDKLDRWLDDEEKEIITDELFIALCCLLEGLRDKIIEKRRNQDGGDGQVNNGKD